MGFFDTYEDEGGDKTYIGKAEKADLIRNKTAFAIESVTFEPGKGYQGGDRFLAIINLNGEERKLSFGAGSVESRDRMLTAMGEFLASEEGQPVTVIIEEVPSKTPGGSPAQTLVAA